MNLKCAIVDDEPLALNLLESYVNKTPFLELTGKYSSAVQAMSDLPDKRVDLLFLDIQMPELNGLEFSRMVDTHTRIVFTTAFDQYAIDGYRVNALDYLLKPIEAPRLEKTLARLRQERSLQDISLLDDTQQALKYIPCTGHSRIWLLQMEDVAFVSSRMSGIYVTDREGKEGFSR